MILNIENSINQKIKDEISGYSIESFPANVRDYLVNFVHPKGAVLINYAGSKFSDPDNPNSNAQTRTLEFDIYVVQRNLKTNRDVYPLLEIVKETLTGFEPEGCLKMYPVSDDFVLEEKGVWVYVMKFNTLAPTD